MMILSQLLSEVRQVTKGDTNEWIHKEVMQAKLSEASGLLELVDFSCFSLVGRCKAKIHT